MSSVDDGVGMVLDTLRATGQLDNTIVIYTSDNGYLLGEHGQFNQKRFAWEESIRIPFLLRYPKIAKPGRRKQMTVSVDLAPTLLELAGVSWPEKLHGQSFVPVMRDPSHPGGQSFLAEYFEEKVFPRCPDWQAVRTSTHKYIRYPGNEDLNELYDLAADPREQENLIRNAAAGAVLERMRKELDRLLTETEYP